MTCECPSRSPPECPAMTYDCATSQYVVPVKSNTVPLCFTYSFSPTCDWVSPCTGELSLLKTYNTDGSIDCVCNNPIQFCISYFKNPLADEDYPYLCGMCEFFYHVTSNNYVCVGDNSFTISAFEGQTSSNTGTFTGHLIYNNNLLTPVKFALTTQVIVFTTNGFIFGGFSYSWVISKYNTNEGTTLYTIYCNYKSSLASFGSPKYLAKTPGTLNLISAIFSLDPNNLALPHPRLLWKINFPSDFYPSDYFIGSIEGADIPSHFNSAFQLVASNVPASVFRFYKNAIYTPAR